MANDPEIKIVDFIDSTNLVLKKMAKEGAPEGTAIIAKEQSAGRGRNGRSFFSPKDAGIYFSILLRPKAHDGFAVTDITPMAGVAASEAIEKCTGKKVGIKWVNDLIYREKKICGILAEAEADGKGGLSYAVLGIGLNVFAPKGGWPDDISDRAGSLFERTGNFAPRAEIGEMSPVSEFQQTADDELKLDIANETISRFMEIYRRNDRTFVDEYKKRCITNGRRIVVIIGKSKRNALALGIDDECRLLVRYEDDGSLEALSGGEISIRNRT